MLEQKNIFPFDVDSFGASLAANTIGRKKNVHFAGYYCWQILTEVFPL